MSKKLEKIILASLVLNFLHMAEVIASGYYLTGFQKLENLFATTSSAIYFSSHIFLYLGITLFFLSHTNKKIFKLGLIAYCWVFFSESHHFFTALFTLRYAPGSITSFLYLVLGVLYIFQLRIDLKAK